MSEGLWGEGALQCLPPDPKICEEHVLVNPYLETACYGGGGGFTPWATCQGMLETLIRMGLVAYFLEQHKDGRLK